MPKWLGARWSEAVGYYGMARPASVFIGLPHDKVNDV